MHAIVALSTFGNKHVKSTSRSERFSKLGRAKCTSLWREEHFEVKMIKTSMCKLGWNLGSCHFRMLKWFVRGYSIYKVLLGVHL